MIDIDINDVVHGTSGLSGEQQALLAMLLEDEGVDQLHEASSIVPRADQNTHPASFAQQRLWFLDQLEPNSPTYVMPGGVRMLGALDVGALARTLNEIVRRHAVLRASFETVDGKPAQRLRSTLELALPLEDLSHLPETEREAEVERRFLLEADRPFDLADGPLLRATLLKVSDTEHILLLTLHHIVADGWSVGVLLEEVAAIYPAFVAGQASPLDDLPIQYADFAAWQQAELEGGALNEQLAYWRRQLGGASTTLDLPTDRARPSVQSYRGASVPFNIPADVAAELRSLARQEQATLFMVLVGGLSAVLSAYSRQHDILIGTPIANRVRPETEGLIGLFANTLVLRTDVSGDPSFRELVRRLRDVTLQAYAHQDLPFERLVDELQVERSLSHNPLFQVMLAVQHGAFTRCELPGLTLESLNSHTQTSKFDLTLEVEETPDALAGQLEYSTDLFDRQTVERLLSHLRNLLAGAAADAERRISQLPLLSSAESERLLVDFNATAAPLPTTQTLPALLDAQADRTPDAVAVVSESGSLTYAELHARANQLAHYLRGLGVGPDVRVAVCLDRSTDLLVGVLGISKAGGAYVPLDPTYPRERLAFMLEDSQVTVLVTQEALLEMLPPTSATVVRIDADWPAIAEQPTQALTTELSPDDLAYVIYTSGSTGKPKGVQVHHRGLVNFLCGMQREIGLQPSDTLAAVTTLSFDIAGLELYLPLSTGARVVVVSRDAIDGESLRAVLDKHQATIMQATPVSWRLLLDADWSPPAGFTGLCGGEALPRELASELLARGVRLFNMYGPTETTVWSTMHLVTTADITSGIPIGKPIQNTSVHVLDALGHPVPIGVPGELFIGGTGVARGYLNRPELTQERFVSDPFSGDPRARVYRTGDLVRFRPDGTLDFLGRLDHQVKVRGFRIELGEIESALAGHADVREAVVVARASAAGDKRLIAYIVPSADDSPPTIGQLHAHLRQSLPEYMLPAAVVVLPELPLTPNGKIDRNALPAPEGRSAMGEYAAPRTPAEATLASIWQDVLGLERVGADDNFFEIGGDSVLSVQIVARARAAGLQFTPKQLFQAQTVAQLAQLATSVASPVESAAQQAQQFLPEEREALLAQVRRAQPVGRYAVEIEDVYSLSPMQQGMLFHHLYNPGADGYFVQWHCTLYGRVDEAALEHAWQQAIDRHPALRTVFAWGEQPRPVQVALKQVQITLERLDWREVDPSEHASRLEAHLREDRTRGFDPSCGPLMRLAIIRTADDASFFVWSHHHLLLDGWSIPLLLQEVLSSYEALRGGRQLMLEPARPFGDYIRWLEQQERGAAEQFWRRTLAGVLAPTPLGLDRVATPEPGQSGFAEEGLHLSTSATDALQLLARTNNLTLNTIVEGGWAILLSRYSGHTDVVFGATVAGRPASLAGVEEMIGLFINTLPVRVQLPAQQSARAWLADLQAFNVESREFEHTPLVDVHGWSEVPRSQPLFNSIVVFENYPRDPKLFDVAGVRVADAHNFQHTNYPLSIIVEPGALLSIRVSYDTSLFDAQTIRRLLGHLQTVLAALADDADQALADLPLLPATERYKILRRFNATERALPEPRTMPALMEAQAASTPFAQAVVTPTETLTYAELHARANQLARYLRGLGVGPEVRVGLCLERTANLVVAALGILKAGGAYVPLDPNYPRDRLAFMLEDSEVAVLVTQQSLSEALPPSEASIVCIDTDWPAIAREPSHAPASELTPDNLAYVIYTSGSTGKPKGTLIQHEGVCNMARAQMDAFGTRPGDRVLQFASLSFDAATFEMTMALCAGAAVCLGGTRDALLPGENLATYLREQQVNVVTLPPTALAALPPGEYPHLRTITVAGEACSADLVARWAPGRKFFNLYGPTESTIWATMAQCVDGTREPSIGQPIANLQAYVLDERLEPVPIGSPGHLYLGGVGLARGYHHRPDLTASRFVPNPFGSPGSRLYHTGDLVRYRSDGNLDFLGRVDHQVKIRGFRIELGEIEFALGSHAEVREAVVVARQSPSGDNRLIAYVVPRSADRAPTMSELHAHLRQSLPEHMLPAAVVVLPSFPLTPNGKVDRQALPAPDATRDRLGGPLVAPRSRLELQLVQLWEQVLGVSPIGVTDHFFDLGGHSMLAVQLMADVQRVIGRPLTLATLLEAGTIERLAQHLDASPTGPASPLVGMRSTGSKRPFFCVHPATGSVLSYMTLAREVDSDRPFYGLQARGLDGDAKPIDNVEEMAAAYVEAMRAAQPQGPYLLGGHSFGGFVAYEMARQLTAAGERVALLAILDTPALGTEAAAATDIDEVSELAGLVRTVERYVGLPVSVSEAELGALSPKDRLAYVHERLRRANVLPPAADLQLVRQHVRVQTANSRAIAAYQPRPAPVRIALFRSDSGEPENPLFASSFDRPDYGWSDLTDEPVEVRHVRGDHITMMVEPHVQVLAEALSAALNEADA
jgi:amino acid adenylation domain-containing protein